jgi:hypothetical protein
MDDQHPAAILIPTGDRVSTLLSPRLQILDQALTSGDDQAIAHFWDELAGSAPLVEHIPHEDDHRYITFVWRGDATTHRVALLGGIPGPEPKLLTRLHQTDLWYRAERYPLDARFAYEFQINGPATWPDDPTAFQRLFGTLVFRTDPYNPQMFLELSYVELPAAPLQPWIAAQPDIPALLDLPG